MKRQDEPGTASVDDLLSLFEIDPDALREAEFAQAQAILDTMVGQSIASASMEDRRIVVTTSNGNRYFFYGFMGNARPPDPGEA
jgi:hypothetical protein